jgi:tRNA nucleotidyltransferase/poly(A) polymerase
VGGAVRDLHLGLEPPELDLVFTGAPASFAMFLKTLGEQPGWSLVKTHDRFGTATFLDRRKDQRIDLAVARMETYAAPGDLPTVSLGASLEVDLRRRDFSINAIAFSLPDADLMDPFEGTRDLERGVLRLLHESSLADDPTRVLRAAKYSARLGFDPEPEGFSEAMARSLSSGAWSRISGDRLRTAMASFLSEGEWTVGLRRVLVPYRVLDAILGRRVHLEAESVPAKERGDWPVFLRLMDREAAVSLADRFSLSRKIRKAAGLV